jgi:hypothetical protein
LELAPQNFSIYDLVATRKGGSFKITEAYQRDASWTQARRMDTTRSVIPCLEDNISTAITRVLARQFEATMKEQNESSEVSGEL